MVNCPYINLALESVADPSIITKGKAIDNCYHQNLRFIAFSFKIHLSRSDPPRMSKNFTLQKN